MKIVTIRPDKEQHRSSTGETRLEGLLVNEKGQVEPVVIIRASEPAAEAAVMALIDAGTALGYEGYERELLIQDLQRVQTWQRENGGVNRRGRVETQVLTMLKDSVKVPAGKK